MLNEEGMLHSGEHGPLRRVPAIKLFMLYLNGCILFCSVSQVLVLGFVEWSKQKSLDKIICLDNYFVYQ